ncbi:MAG: class I SAM-dependent methyltransferase, partial [Flavobacteriales bacterium]|nr:class I SAM-dependent methyltransferase [Flavobacteriales bacterium]
AEQLRMEQVTGNYDVIVTRAVAPLSKLRRWLYGKLSAKSKKSVTGLICLKGGDLFNEITEARMKAKLYNISNLFEEEFFETKKVVWVSSL